MATERKHAQNKDYVNLAIALGEPMDDTGPIYGLWKEGTNVSIFLSNGIKLVGTIEWFDGECLVLRNGCDQMVFRNQIATILPPMGTFFQ